MKKSSQKLILIIALSIIAWLLTASSPGSSGRSANIIGMPIPPLNVDLELASLPGAGEPTQLNATVNALEDAPGTTVEIHLPDGVELVSGDLVWQGDLAAGGSASFSATIVFKGEGEFEITASGSSPIDENNTRLGEGSLGVNISTDARNSQIGLTTQDFSEEPGQVMVVLEGVTLEEPKEAQPETAEPKEAQACGTVRAYGWAYFRNSSNTAWVPARYVRVELWDDDSWSGDDYLGSDIADSNGYWSVGPVSQSDEWFSCGLDIYNKFVYDASWGRVENGSGNRYGWKSGTVNNVGDGTHSFGGGGIPYSLEEFRARNIYLTVRRAWANILVRAHVPAAKARVQYRHSHTSSDTWPHFKRSTQKIYLPGVGQDWSNSNKQKTILHELGHHYQWELYGNWLPTTYCPSPHYINGASHNNCAWTEGFATWVALFVDNSPNAYGYNYENLPRCSSFTCGSDVEGRVTASLYDMYDSNNEGPHDVYTAGLSGGKDKIWDTVDRGGRHDNFWEFWVSYRNRYPKYSVGRDPCKGVRAIRQNNGTGADGGYIWFNEWVDMGNVPTQYMTINQTKYIDLWVYADDYECRDSDLTYVIDYVSNPGLWAQPPTVTASDFIRLVSGSVTGWSLIRIWAGDGLMWDYDYFWVNVSLAGRVTVGEAPPAEIVEAELVAISTGDNPPGAPALNDPMAAPGAPAPELVAMAAPQQTLTPPLPETPLPTSPPETITPEPSETAPPPFETPEPTATPTGQPPTETPTPTPTLDVPPTLTPNVDPTDVPTPTPTATPTELPTSFPPTPTATPPALSLSPGVVSLKQHQVFSFTVENGQPPYAWFATGGSISPDGIYTAGDERGEFVVSVTDNLGSEAVAGVLIGGLEISLLDPSASTHISIGETLEFTVDDLSASVGDALGNRGPFLWILDGGGPSTSVGTIQAQAGGDQAIFTAEGNGTALVTAYGTDPDGQVINSNSILVIVGNTMEIPDVKGVPGQQANIRVNLSNIALNPISNLEMTIQYPANLLSFQSAEPTFRTANFTVGSNQITTDKIKIILTSLTGESIDPGQGPILDLIFDVSNAANIGDSGPIAFEPGSVTMLDAQVPPQEIPIQTSDGTFEVVDAANLAHDGDVDRNGKVNVRDLALAVLIFLNRYAASTEEFAAADISPLTTGDGSVNVTDALKIFNKALGKPIALLRQRVQLGPIALRAPNQASASVGEELTLPIELNHLEDAVGGMDFSLVYSATTGTFTPTLAVAQRAQHMRADLNTDTDGQVKVILYSPDTVQAIEPGEGNLLTLNFGTVAEDVSITVGFESSILSDVAGNELGHSTELYDPTANDDPTGLPPSIYLPLVVK